MQTFIAALAARRHPVLTFLPAGQPRLELTGTVVANWVYKTVGLFAETGLGPDLGLGILVRTDQPLHWRALVALLAAAGAEAPVTLLAEDGTAEPDGPWAAFVPEGSGEDPLTASADEVFVYAAEALALSAETPPGCIDFTAAVRSHPDVCPIPGRQCDLTVLSGERIVLPIAEVGGEAEATGASGADLLTTGIPAGAGDLRALLGALLHGQLTLTDG